MEVGVRCRSCFSGCRRFWFGGLHVDSLLHVEAAAEAEERDQK